MNSHHMLHQIQRWFCLIFIFLIVKSSILTAQNHPDSSYSVYCLPHTEVRRIHSKIINIDYVLYISFPRNYAASDKSYPAVYTLDADYSFALAHNIIEHFVDRRNLPEMIVVSIAYEGASQDMSVYRYNRTRDYTPTFSPHGGYGPEFQKHSGGGKKFRTFIIQELIPYIESHYRAKSNDRTLVGHSYGGLFGTFVLLTRPEAFQRYILVSPSLWYDDEIIFNFEREFAENYQSLNARVFFAVGSHENQPWRGWPMIDDMKRMVSLLKSRNIKGLEISGHVFENETHNSIFPTALTRGLRVVFE